MPNVETPWNWKAALDHLRAHPDDEDAKNTAIDKAESWFDCACESRAAEILAEMEAK